MKNYLYHGIKWFDYKLLVKILENGYIVPRCMLKDGISSDTNNLFNGNKYISLCQKSLWGELDKLEYKCSFDDYIFNRPALVLKRENIDIAYPNLITKVESGMMSPEKWKKITFNDDDERYSYYSDELQTKEKISLKDNLIAVGLPGNHLKRQLSTDEAKQILKSVKEALIKSELDVPILDSSIYSFADDEECIKKNILKLH